VTKLLFTLTSSHSNRDIEIAQYANQVKETKERKTLQEKKNTISTIPPHYSPNSLILFQTSNNQKKRTGLHCVLLFTSVCCDWSQTHYTTPICAFSARISITLSPISKGLSSIANLSILCLSSFFLLYLHAKEDVLYEMEKAFLVVLFSPPLFFYILLP
jgi:hypothetical protein